MRDLLQFIFGEVKNGRLSKADAVDFLRQIGAHTVSGGQADFLHPPMWQNTSDLSLTSNFEGSPVPQPEEPYEMMTFEEVWAEEVLPDVGSLKIRTVVCFLSDSENQQAIAEAISNLNQQVKLIFISQSKCYQKLTSQRYQIDRLERNTYEEAFRSIWEDCGEVDAIFYLWPLEDPGCIQDYSGIVYLIQAIAAAKFQTKRVLLGAEFEEKRDRCYLESWIGFERTMGLIMPNTQLTAVYQEAGKRGTVNLKEWPARLWGELQTPKAQSVWYQKGKRHVCRIRPINIASGENPVKKEGTYLITGGCGGLGYLFAAHLAKTQPVNLILTGRSPLDEEKQAKIKALEDLGSGVWYVQADVSDRTGMKTGLDQARERFGAIHGVIHAAGINDHQSILGKEFANFQKVLDPKIKGTLVLDELLEAEPLDFTCYFSSLTPILGDFGSCDYAIANRFLMAYAHYRKQEKRYHGKTVVINWPIWKEGGMGTGKGENIEMVLKASGQRYLDAEEGLAVFNRILAQEKPQIIVTVGQPSRVRRFFGLIPGQPAAESPLVPGSPGRGRRPEMKGFSLEQCLEWDLKEQISQLLKIPHSRMERQENLAAFGFNSINLTRFAAILSNHYGFEITPSVFYGYPTLQKLTQYFLREHQKAIREFYKEDNVPLSFTHSIPPPPTRQPEPGILRLPGTGASQNQEDPIAIIGMSGRFPQSRNVDEMWRIIVEGRSAVEEIPADRFDWRPYFGDPTQEPDKFNCKWCGSIPGVREFDPLFFEISPREAEMMDPRQRLLLQEAWKALEDAGYGAKQLQTGKVGMFVGVEMGDYQLLSKQWGSLTSNLNSILAARLAYFLNLNGPVMAIDTACSSGLVATHQACLSLRNHECDTAIAAGVNFLLSPEAYQMMSQAGILSPDGKCYTFDQRANGMVPGEAVAVVVLKPLSRAEADGDPVYAVIRGSGVNYDGKTNGITAPSGVSQTGLLKSVYDQYRVNPEEIEYIVTHGTGTKLGDPIEVNALNEVFKNYTKKTDFCALTSTKTNFGHCFSPSGIISLISLVQAFRHEIIPASLHCEKENDFINWKESPFYVNKAIKPWIKKRGKSRIGAVSAFGMSGTNVHMVVQSYEMEETGPFQDNCPYYLLVLSAKTEAALEEKMKDLAAILEKESGGADLSNVSYTLLEGRHHFSYRAAFVVQDREDAIRVLRKSGSKDKLPNSFQGKVARDFTGQKALEEFLHDLLRQSRSFKGNRSKYQEILLALADLYCQGYVIDGDQLCGDLKPHRIHLPGYPFAREHYWIPETDARAPVGANVRANNYSPLQQATIHPLLHRNTSDLSEQRFSSTFTGREFFLADHLIRGQRILPGMAHLEMARAAVRQAAKFLNGNQPRIRLKNVGWFHPLVVSDQPVEVHIGVYPEDNGEIGFKVYSQTGDERVIHSQGRAVLIPATKVPALDLHVRQAQCILNTLRGDQCYELLKKGEMDYGPRHQGLREVYIGEGQALAKLALPDSISGTKDDFFLHPCLLDAASLATFGLELGTGDLMSTGGKLLSKPYVPISLQEVEVIKKCPSTMWALIYNHEGNVQGGKSLCYDIDLCDDQGAICVRLKAYTLRPMEGKADSPGSTKDYGMVMFYPLRKESAPVTETPAPVLEQHLVILCEPGVTNQESMAAQMSGVRFLILQTKRKGKAERFNAYAVQVFEEIRRLLQEKPKGRVLIQLVVFTGEEKRLFSGLFGLVKTAGLENPQLIGQLIELAPGEDAAGMIEKLKENGRNLMESQISYQDGKRWVTGWSEVTALRQEEKIPWKDRGIYLLTGGAGGLGLILAREIAEKVQNPILILTGRSPFRPEKQSQLGKLEALGARVEYRQVDVAQKKAVMDLIGSIRRNFGGLDGIIHCAGLIRDNYLIKKTGEELQEVLAPKVTGLVNLDEASMEIPLDFFLLYSSVAGSLGNPGQADYSAANAFMDVYAGYRNHLAASGERHGRTLAINWPYWKEGGIRVDPETERMMLQSAGMIAMETKTGLRAIYQGMASGQSQVMVIEGNVGIIKKYLGLERPHSEPVSAIATGTGSKLIIKENDAAPKAIPAVMQDKAIAYFRELLSSTLHLPVNRIEAGAPFGQYGINSIVAMQLTIQLEKRFGTLPKTLFFEYLDLQSLTEYFLDSHYNQLRAVLGIENKAVPTVKSFTEPVPAPEPKLPVPGISQRSRWAPWTESPKEKEQGEGIAVIGVAGRYPGAGNIEDFWKNLRDGKDCITEIPRERWDHSLYYDEDRNKPGKTNCKWGGFLEEIDRFDPLFFNISPNEAEIMDPMERLFLETVWNLLEGAGYTRETLGLLCESRVGVFVGASIQQYHAFETDSIREAAVAVSNFGSIANRVSYYFNFHGPSIAIDTMCSSSAIAIHMACESLIKGECRTAVAGGVNLSINPKKYLGLTLGQVIGSNPDSRSFGDGDGFLPAEGVGAVLLKPLSQAIQDRDFIYAVIKSTATNHGGTSNGYSVPNSNAQEELIESNFRKSGIDPRTISYVESAVSGSALGDPTEIAALTKVFRKFTAEHQFCPIGSVKSNIGHPEAASGISQLTKVILQLQHQQLVPTIKAEPLNPNLDFIQTPFYLQRELAKWKRPVVMVNGMEEEAPRRATVSSFGAGGSNAHLIIEEYHPARPETARTQEASKPQILVFSAKNQERLQAVVRQILEFIEARKDLSLTNLAYTLQIGREAMNSRVAMVVNNFEELRQGIKEYLNSTNKGKAPGGSIPIFTGDPDDDISGVRSLLSGKTGQTVLQEFLAERNLEKLALYWTSGGKIPWETLHEGEGARRISLPTYPFLRKRFWISEVGGQAFIPSGDNRLIRERTTSRTDGNNLSGQLKKRISEILGIPVEELPDRKPLLSLGSSSVKTVSLRYKLERDFGIEIPMAFVSEHFTIEQIDRKIREIIPENNPDQQHQKEAGLPDYEKKSNSHDQILTGSSEILPEIIPDLADRAQPFPLSDIQESFLAGRKLRFGGDWVGCHLYFEIERNDLDIYRLNKAWERLIHYHEMLRAVVLADGKQKMQDETPPYTIKVSDLRLKNSLERSQYFQQVREKMSHRVYETGQWPLFEIRITVHPDGKYVIHFSIDEYIIDAGGVNMLFRQWRQLYEAPESTLPELNLSFRDYLLAIKKFEDSKRYRRDLDYWVGKLASMPNGPKLPLSTNPDHRDNFYRARLFGELEEKDWSVLKKKARELNVSTTALLLTIFGEVLRLGSGQETFSLILTFFNRLPLHPQVDQILGPFISTTFFVMEEKRGRGLEELIRDHQEGLWNDLDHSSVSGVRVLRELKVRRKILSSLYLPVVFTSLLNAGSENEARQKSFFPEITFSVTQTPQVYLDHQTFEQDGKLKFSWDVSEKYFEPGLIGALFSDYRQVLRALASSDEPWEFAVVASEVKGNKGRRSSAVEGDFKTEAAAAISPAMEISLEDLQLEVANNDRFKPFPLTDQQQAYAFGRSNYVAGGKNSSQFYQEIKAEKLDIRRLENAWRKLLKTHEMLRTVIQSDGRQRVLEEVPDFQVPVADLTGKKAGEVRAELDTTKRLMVDRVFPLDQWPYFDLRVSVIDSIRSRIHLSIDMLIADGNSIHLLVKQLFYFYEHPNEDPGEIGVSFRDYVISLQRYQKTAGYQRSIRYWENKFAKISPGPQLPMSKLPDQPLPFEHERFEAVLPNWEALKKAAGKLGVAPSMILLTAYAEVCAAWSGNQPFTIVIPCWERLPLHPEIDEVIGDFTAMSWVVIGEEQGTFEEKAQRNHRVVREDLSHMAVSGLKALRKAVLRRGKSGLLTFPVVFTDLTPHTGLIIPEGFKLGEALSKTPQVFIDTMSEEQGNQLYLYWDVLKGVYSEGMVAAMFAGYKRVLEALAGEPKGWGKIDFGGLIKAAPEKYRG